MANTYGRQVVVPLTNKSGGGVIAGDVVIVDTANDAAFTTTTTSATTVTVGIAQETIANSATGRVLLSGYAALVNVNASVTRGHYGATHTVAKQATDAGASRIAGTFCEFLTGGTTPTAAVWQPDLGGGSGAPTDALYIVGAANGSLSQERALPYLYKNYDPSAKPAASNAVSNEFDGSSGGAYTWTTTPGASDENTTAPGHLYLMANTNQAAAYYYYRTAYAPGATAFSVAAKLAIQIPNAGKSFQVGIALLDSSDAVIWRSLILDDGSNKPFAGYRYNDTNAATVAFTANAFTSYAYLLIQRDASNVYTGFFSMLGLPGTWMTMGSSTVATTVAKVGIATLSSTTTVGEGIVDFIRVFDSATKAIGA